MLFSRVLPSAMMDGEKQPRAPHLSVSDLPKEADTVHLVSGALVRPQAPQISELSMLCQHAHDEKSGLGALTAFIA